MEADDRRQTYFGSDASSVLYAWTGMVPSEIVNIAWRLLTTLHTPSSSKMGAENRAVGPFAAARLGSILNEGLFGQAST